MDAVTHARTLATYNRWANNHLYAQCAQLSDEMRKRDVGAFFSSIHGTLNHLLLGDSVWFGRFTARAFVVTSLAQELHADFAALRAAREDLDDKIEHWAASLTVADLSRELRYTGIANPIPRSYSMWFAVLHFFNHQTHHRGQVTTLLMQQGIDPGGIDLILMSHPER
ncbi:MAG: damage-inducible protein DinB [Gammaproteobacteria bacterium]|nr:damage-inducible protein DinB [Gammaproteobacteria bacterium]